ncbi:HlyD family efflux transporter periplasmic adaptor subunit [Desulfobulbus sp.]|uniref:HlyD family secretion protein n=1 Tax=Desulfobulbus sp. TaxID=895 RepID=UPI00286F1D49|nr:HlyD family efflux transporter periplasmic adaptor subunit [Desulfobulbus sp.]
MNKNLPFPCFDRSVLRIRLTMALCLLLCALSANGCGGDAANRAQGYVEGEYVYVASPFGGRLETLKVRRGQAVSPGTGLFDLEAVEEREEVARAERELAAQKAVLADLRLGKRPPELEAVRAQLAGAKAEEERSAKQLRRDTAQRTSGAISQADLEVSQTRHATDAQRVRELGAQLEVAELAAREHQIEAQVALVGKAEAALAECRWRLAQKSPLVPVASPAPCLVVDTLFRIGEWVPPGTPVVKLLPPDKVKIRFFVPEQTVTRLILGQRVLVRVDGWQEPVACRISFVGPEAEYTPPVIYSNDTRRKLIFPVEAHPDAPPDFAASQAQNQQEQTVRVPTRPPLHPGLPVTVELP